MSKKVSHTIRFDKEEKEEIVALGNLSGRGFQSQVDWMLKQQLKMQRVFLFLNRVQCALEAMDEEYRDRTMAKIANITNIELE
jgi:hypothetical protein